MTFRSTDIRNHLEPGNLVFGRTLSQALVQHGRTQSNLANAINCNKSDISRYCRGSVLPPQDRLRQILGFFSDTLTKQILQRAHSETLTVTKSHTIHAPPGEDPLQTIARAMREGNLQTAHRLTLDQRRITTDPETTRKLIELEYEQNLLLDNLSECPKLIKHFPVSSGPSKHLHLAQKQAMKGIALRLLGWETYSQASSAFVQASNLLRYFNPFDDAEITQKRRTLFIIHIQHGHLQVSQMERNPNLKDNVGAVSQAFDELLKKPLPPTERAECLEASTRCRLVTKETEVVDAMLTELRKIKTTGTSSLSVRIELLAGKASLLKNQLDEAIHFFELALTYAKAVNNQRHTAQAERMLALAALARS